MSALPGSGREPRNHLHVKKPKLISVSNSSFLCLSFIRDLHSLCPYTLLHSFDKGESLWKMLKTNVYCLEIDSAFISVGFYNITIPLTAIVTLFYAA